MDCIGKVVYSKLVHFRKRNRKFVIDIKRVCSALNAVISLCGFLSKRRGLKTLTVYLLIFMLFIYGILNHGYFDLFDYMFELIISQINNSFFRIYVV